MSAATPDLGKRDPYRQLTYWREVMPRPEGPLHPSRRDLVREPGPDVPETLTVRVGAFRLDLADGGKMPAKLVADVLGAKRIGRRRIGKPATFAALGVGGPAAAYAAAMSSGSWAPVPVAPARPLVAESYAGTTRRAAPAPTLTAAERRYRARAERYGYPVAA